MSTALAAFARFSEPEKTKSFSRGVRFVITGRYKEDTDIVGAFSDRDFAVCGYTEKGLQTVELISEGLRSLDLALWMGGAANIFGRGGLVIVRPSLTPQVYIDKFNDDVLERRKLQEAARQTGIEARLTDALGAYPYHALSPSWNVKLAKSPTKHPVVFWLNPANQKAYTYGWFTVEELEQWARGKGPVLKTPANAST